MNNPLVSISCITYNHAPYIRQCLDGFLMQQCDFEYEILIHDDASTDGTSDIIREYQKKYPEIIKPIIQTENQWSQGVRGINIKFNFSRAKGKYIALCEGDDYWTDPLKLQKQVSFLERNPEYVLVGSLAGKIYEEENFKKIHYPKSQNDFDFDTGYLILQNPISTLTACFRSGVVTEIPDIYFSGGSGGDRRLYILLSQFGKCRFIDEQVGVYRIHKGGVTNSYRKGTDDVVIEKLKRSIKHAENWNNYLGGLYNKEVEIIKNKQYPKITKLYFKNKKYNLASEYANNLKTFKNGQDFKTKCIIIVLKFYYLYQNIFQKRKKKSNDKVIKQQ